jgi:hypothetical protein
VAAAAMWRRWAQAGSPSASRNSHDSMKQWWRLLKSMLKDMVADHDLPRDPTDRTSTIRTYEIDLSHHILPRLGYLTCDQVNCQAVEGWRNWATQQTQPAERSMKKTVNGELRTFTYVNVNA